MAWMTVGHQITTEPQLLIMSWVLSNPLSCKVRRLLQLSLRIVSAKSSNKLEQDQRVHANYTSILPRPLCHPPVLFYVPAYRSFPAHIYSNIGDSYTQHMEEDKAQGWFMTVSAQYMSTVWKWTAAALQLLLLHWKRVVRENPPNEQSLRWGTSLYILCRNKRNKV